MPFLRLHPAFPPYLIGGSRLRLRLGGKLEEAVLQFGAHNRALADAIYDAVITRYGRVDGKAATELYRGLLGVWQEQIAREFHCGPTLPFFTLNYDLAVEDAASGLNLKLVDGIVPASGGRHRQWSPTAFTGYGEEADRLAVVLVKLHGSVNLGRNKATGELVELPPEVLRDPSPYEHAVLYPTRGTKKLDDDPYRTNYRLLRECLLNAALLVVIGCSLRDDQLNDLVDDSMSQNQALHVLVVGPEADCIDLAERIGWPPQRVAVGVGRFALPVELEEFDIAAGRGRLINLIRRSIMAATSLKKAPALSPFGHNQEF